MITARQIISEVQSEFNDLSQTRFAYAELVDAFNHVVREIARRTEVWIGRYVVVPNPLTSTWTAADNYEVGQIVEYNGNYFIALVTNIAVTPVDGAVWKQCLDWDETLGTTYTKGDVVYTSNTSFYRAVQDVPTNIDITDDTYWGSLQSDTYKTTKVVLPYTDANSNILSIYKLIAVHRKNNSSTEWNVCLEMSPQAVIRHHGTNYNYTINHNTDDGFSVNHLNEQRTNPSVDGSMTLVFTQPFDYNEQCIVDYISGNPIQLQTWVTQDSMADDMNIPDFMGECVKFGLSWRLSEKAYNKGDERFAPRADRNYMHYQTMLSEAIVYAKRVKNQAGQINIQPYDVLPENDKNFYQL
jgi:hypothetical protein